jgi:hypothetical protein
LSATQSPFFWFLAFCCAGIRDLLSCFMRRPCAGQRPRREGATRMPAQKKHNPSASAAKKPITD